MVLNKAEIVTKGLVPNGTADGRRDTTYDTTIEEIIECGNAVGPTHILKSRGVVWVVSKEEFNLPDNVTGLAALKTSWAHDGIFALNVGVIDPGWKGPVATALVNFGRDPVTISKGQAFLRVMFHEGTGVPGSTPPPYGNRREYLGRIADKSRAFSNTFLNMAELANEVGRDVLKLPKWAYVLTILAVVISFASVFAPMAYTVWVDGAHNKETISGMESRLKVMEEGIKKDAIARQQALAAQAKATKRKPRRKAIPKPQATPQEVLPSKASTTAWQNDPSGAQASIRSS